MRLTNVLLPFKSQPKKLQSLYPEFNEETYNLSYIYGVFCVAFSSSFAPVYLKYFSWKWIAILSSLAIWLSCRTVYQIQLFHWSTETCFFSLLLPLSTHPAKMMNKKTTSPNSSETENLQDQSVNHHSNSPQILVYNHSEISIYK